MQKNVIALDMDGVVYPFVDAFSYLYKKLGGQGPVEWSGWDCYTGFLSQDVVSAVWEHPDLFSCAEPYPFAVTAVEEILDLGYDVYFVTSGGRSPDLSIAAKWKWIQEFFPGWGWKRFVALHDKFRFSANIMVDDKWHNVKSWLDFDFERETGILVERSWSEYKHSEDFAGRYYVTGGIEYVPRILEEFWG